MSESETEAVEEPGSEGGAGAADRVAPGEAPRVTGFRFYHEPWVVVLATMAIPPLGVLLIWNTPEFDRRLKRWLSIGVAVVLVVLLGIEGDSGAFQELGSELVAGLHQRAALGYLRAGQLDEAEAAIGTAFEFSPEEPQVAWAAARIAEARVGDRKETVRWLHLAVKPEGKFTTRVRSTWVASLGRVYVDDGYPEARVREVLDALGEFHKRHPRASLLEAELYLREGKLGRAEKAARRNVTDFEVAHFGETYELLSRIAEKREEPLTAAYYLTEAHRHEPWVVEAGERKKRALKLAKQAGAATVPLQAFMNALALRGPIGKRKRTHPEDSALADRILARLLEKHPTFWAGDLVLHTRGSYAFYETEDFAVAAGFYERVLKDFPRGETRCRCLYQLVRAHQETEEFAAGLRRARQLEVDCPGDLAASSDVFERRILKQQDRKRREEKGDR